jgi:hypothetical protein
MSSNSVAAVVRRRNSLWRFTFRLLKSLLTGWHPIGLSPVSLEELKALYLHDPGNQQLEMEDHELFAAEYLARCNWDPAAASRECDQDPPKVGDMSYNTTRRNAYKLLRRFVQEAEGAS